MGKIIHGDNLTALKTIKSESVDLIYIDPPFNTRKVQQRTFMRTVQDEKNGDRTGFNGKRYRTIKIGTSGYIDYYDDFLDFLEPRIKEAYRILKSNGSFFLHIDYREAHYSKILLDSIFNRESFMNEIIWAYDYGARSRKKWSSKHDAIFWYAKDPNNYTYNYSSIDRIPYMAPGLVGKEKAKIGKTHTDVWWNTIVSPNGKEKTGYATQKPIKIIERIVKVHSNPGATLLDFFAGSGTFGEAAAKNKRDFILVDSNLQAINIMKKRLEKYNPVIDRL